MGRTLLLTGEPGVGKTTLIRAVAQALGERAGGFYTQELRGPGGRHGFQLYTLDGKQTIMAHVKLRGAGRPQVGRYGVDVGAIDRVGVAALRAATAGRELVVIDEIGKMELFSGPFRDVTLQAIHSPKPVIATAMSKPNPWVEALKVLPQVTVWAVTPQNRDALLPRVLAWVDSSPGRTAGRPGTT